MFVTIWTCTHEWSLISRRTTAFTFATCHQPFSCRSRFTLSSSVRSFRLPRAGTRNPHRLDRRALGHRPPASELPEYMLDFVDSLGTRLVAERGWSPPPALFGVDTPHGSGPVPKTRPQKIRVGTSPEERRPRAPVQAVLERYALPRTIEPLPIKEVLCATRRQVILQALCGALTELEPSSRGSREVLCAANCDNRTSRFAGISSNLEPSDGLEPSTPSLPWRCSTN